MIMELSNRSSGEKSFPAKILLFGEYSILKGSDACAFPLHKFSGKLVPTRQETKGNHLLDTSGDGLQKLLMYLNHDINRNSAALILDIERLSADIENGLSFDSDIPKNYGTGSSGALTAAIYHTYGLKQVPVDHETLRSTLAFMESAFHGKSSGIDPLVSYLDQSIFLINGEVHSSGESLENLENQFAIELVDSGRPGATHTGVSNFVSGNSIGHSHDKLFTEAYLPLINSLVSDLWHNRATSLMDRFLQVSDLQLRLFPHLFTENMTQLAQDGLDSGKHALKLCGSGGGGFYLRISEV